MNAEQAPNSFHHTICIQDVATQLAEFSRVTQPLIALSTYTPNHKLFGLTCIISDNIMRCTVNDEREGKEMELVNYFLKFISLIISNRAFKAAHKIK